MIGTSERLRSSRQTASPSVSGKPDVEQDDVGLARLERGGSGRDPLDGEPFAAQAFGERLRDRVLVLDEQELHGASVPPR